MALFGKNKKAAAKPEAKKEAAASSVVALPQNPGAVLLRPRLTEKGAILSERGMYAFEVHKDATKEEIKKAIAATFKVTAVSVRIVPVPRKKSANRRTGKIGQTKGGKKAYVALKAGDKIELV